MPDNRPLVVVDFREPENAAQRLQAYGLTAITTSTTGGLVAGDYAFWPHRISSGIERKTISNLLQSMSDKQLVQQAHKMVDSYQLPWLLREGAFRRSPAGVVEYESPRDPRADTDGWVRSGWSWDSFQSIMLDIQLMGIRIMDCPVLGEYPIEIARLVINLSRDEHRWIKERQRPEVVTLDVQWRNDVWSLAAHTGIGPGVGEDLLRDVGSEYKVVRLAVEAPEKLAEVMVGKTDKRPKGRKLGLKLAASLGAELSEEWQA